MKLHPTPLTLEIMVPALTPNVVAMMARVFDQLTAQYDVIATLQPLRSLGGGLWCHNRKRPEYVIVDLAVSKWRILYPERRGVVIVE
jgi:hypothetical protein